MTPSRILETQSVCTEFCSGDNGDGDENSTQRNLLLVTGIGNNELERFVVEGVDVYPLFLSWTESTSSILSYSIPYIRQSE